MNGGDLRDFKLRLKRFFRLIVRVMPFRLGRKLVTNEGAQRICGDCFAINVRPKHFINTHGGNRSGGRGYCVIECGGAEIKLFCAHIRNHEFWNSVALMQRSEIKVIILRGNGWIRRR